MAGPSQITSLLNAAQEGDPTAADQLWKAVYEELHMLARAQMVSEGRLSSLQTTILVHEAYLRLTGGEKPAESGNGQAAWASRRHFFAAAAKAMRRIRVDDARRRRCAKRGGNRTPGDLGAAPGVCDFDPAELIAVDEALEKLQQRDPRKAEVVMLRYFAGLTIDETAHAMGLSPRTVDNEWRFARAWLYRELSAGDGGAAAGE